MAGAGGVYTGGGATVVMDPPSVIWVRVFHPASGPDRHLRQKANAVATLARTLAPKDTGRLAASISVDQMRTPQGRFASGYKVSVGTGYGYYVHEGTGISQRWAHGRAMKWIGREGLPVYRRHVWHPGTPAQPFLQNALVAMVG